MPARHVWKGFLRLSLVTVPVRAYTANAPGGGEIHLNQIHATCHNRIKYKKTCPVHGEVPNDEIVSGYEFAKGQFVVIDPAELDKLRTESDRAIQVNTFVRPDALDPVYHSGQTYYLAPDGPVGAKPYALLHDGMVRLDLHAIAQVVLRGREQLVLLRPAGKVIAMTMLNYSSQVLRPEAFEPDVATDAGSPAETDLVDTLLRAQTAERLEFDKFKDAYTDKLTALIEAKVAGKEIVAPQEAAEHAQVLSLMDALKQSVDKIQGDVAGKPPKKMAPSVSKKGAARKSS
jgi:DNA end-binding protein Ku